MLRKAEDRDVAAMREWRNQPANREVSVNDHVITPEEHRAWWTQAQGDPSRRILVFEHDGRPLGVVNFFDLDFDGDVRTGRWGFFLDYETTTTEGTSTTAWLRIMREASDFAFDPEPNGLALDLLCAEVLEDNEAVRMMNRRFRFVEGPAETRVVDGRTITVLPVSLRREDRRSRKGERL